MAALRLGDEISGRTAGKGNEGAGDAERRNEGEDPNDDLRLPDTAGGSMGNGVVNGVPGLEGAGEVMVRPEVLALEVR